MATFIAPRKLFQTAVNRVCGIIPRRQFKDVLRNVRVSVNGHVEFDATTGTQSHHLATDWQRDGEATVLVNGKQLNDAAKLASGVDVLVDVSANGIRIGGVTIPAYVPDAPSPTGPLPPEFPPLGHVVGNLAPIATVSIDAARLRMAIDATEFAADDESTRYALGGILFDFSTIDAILRLVTTDSRRLAVCEVGPFVADVAELKSFVMPIDVCRRLAKSLDKVDGAVVLTVFAAPLTADGKFDPAKTDGPVRFALPNGITVDTDAVQGRFPDWRKVVPHYQDGEVAILAVELAQLCKAVMSVGTDEARGTDWTFPHPGFLVAKASTSLGTVDQSVVVSTRGIVGGESITLDPRYILEFAASLPKKATIRMKFADTRLSGSRNGGTNFQECPVVMTEETTRVTYVSMPLSRDR